MVVRKDFTLLNFVWKFSDDQLDPTWRKLEFDTGLEIKPKDPSFPCVTEPCYSLDYVIHS